MGLIGLYTDFTTLVQFSLVLTSPSNWHECVDGKPACKGYIAYHVYFVRNNSSVTCPSVHFAVLAISEMMNKDEYTIHHNELRISEIPAKNTEISLSKPNEVGPNRGAWPNWPTVYVSAYSSEFVLD